MAFRLRRPPAPPDLTKDQFGRDIDPPEPPQIPGFDRFGREIERAPGEPVPPLIRKTQTARSARSAESLAEEARTIFDAGPVNRFQLQRVAGLISASGFKADSLEQYEAAVLGAYKWLQEQPPDVRERVLDHIENPDRADRGQPQLRKALGILPAALEGVILKAAQGMGADVDPAEGPVAKFMRAQDDRRSFESQESSAVLSEAAMSAEGLGQVYTRLKQDPKQLVDLLGSVAGSVVPMGFAARLLKLVPFFYRHARAAALVSEAGFAAAASVSDQAQMDDKGFVDLLFTGALQGVKTAALSSMGSFVGRRIGAEQWEEVVSGVHSGAERRALLQRMSASVAVNMAEEAAEEASQTALDNWLTDRRIGEGVFGSALAGGAAGAGMGALAGASPPPQGGAHGPGGMFDESAAEFKPPPEPTEEAVEAGVDAVLKAREEARAARGPAAEAVQAVEAERPAPAPEPTPPKAPEPEVKTPEPEPQPTPPEPAPETVKPPEEKPAAVTPEPEPEPAKPPEEKPAAAAPEPEPEPEPAPEPPPQTAPAAAPAARTERAEAPRRGAVDLTKMFTADAPAEAEARPAPKPEAPAAAEPGPEPEPEVAEEDRAGFQRDAERLVKAIRVGDFKGEPYPESYINLLAEDAANQTGFKKALEEAEARNVAWAVDLKNVWAAYTEGTKTPAAPEPTGPGGRVRVQKLDPKTVEEKPVPTRAKEEGALGEAPGPVLVEKQRHRRPKARPPEPETARKLPEHEPEKALKPGEKKTFLKPAEGSAWAESQKIIDEMEKAAEPEPEPEKPAQRVTGEEFEKEFQESRAAAAEKTKGKIRKRREALGKARETAAETAAAEQERIRQAHLTRRDEDVARAKRTGRPLDDPYSAKGLRRPPRHYTFEGRGDENLGRVGVSDKAKREAAVEDVPGVPERTTSEDIARAELGFPVTGRTPGLGDLTTEDVKQLVIDRMTERSRKRSEGEPEGPPEEGFSEEQRGAVPEYDPDAETVDADLEDPVREGFQEGWGDDDKAYDWDERPTVKDAAAESLAEETNRLEQMSLQDLLTELRARDFLGRNDPKFKDRVRGADKLIPWLTQQIADRDPARGAEKPFKKRRRRGKAGWNVQNPNLFSPHHWKGTVSPDPRAATVSEGRHHDPEALWRGKRETPLGSPWEDRAPSGLSSGDTTVEMRADAALREMPDYAERAAEMLASEKAAYIRYTPAKDRAFRKFQIDWLRNQRLADAALNNLAAVQAENAEAARVWNEDVRKAARTAVDAALERSGLTIDPAVLAQAEQRNSLREVLDAAAAVDDAAQTAARDAEPPTEQQTARADVIARLQSRLNEPALRDGFTAAYAAAHPVEGKKPPKVETSDLKWDPDKSAYAARTERDPKEGERKTAQRINELKREIEEHRLRVEELYYQDLSVEGPGNLWMTSPWQKDSPLEVRIKKWKVAKKDLQSLQEQRMEVVDRRKVKAVKKKIEEAEAALKEAEDWVRLEREDRNEAEWVLRAKELELDELLRRQPDPVQMDMFARAEAQKGRTSPVPESTADAVVQELMRRYTLLADRNGPVNDILEEAAAAGGDAGAEILYNRLPSVDVDVEIRTRRPDPGAFTHFGNAVDHLAKGVTAISGASHLASGFAPDLSVEARNHARAEFGRAWREFKAGGMRSAEASAKVIARMAEVAQTYGKDGGKWMKAVLRGWNTPEGRSIRALIGLPTIPDELKNTVVTHETEQWEHRRESGKPGKRGRIDPPTPMDSTVQTRTTPQTVETREAAARLSKSIGAAVSAEGRSGFVGPGGVWMDLKDLTPESIGNLMQSHIGHMPAWLSRNKDAMPGLDFPRGAYLDLIRAVETGVRRAVSRAIAKGGGKTKEVRDKLNKEMMETAAQWAPGRAKPHPNTVVNDIVSLLVNNPAAAMSGPMLRDAMNTEMARNEGFNSALQRMQYSFSNPSERSAIDYYRALMDSQSASGVEKHYRLATRDMAARVHAQAHPWEWAWTLRMRPFINSVNRMLFNRGEAIVRTGRAVGDAEDAAWASVNGLASLNNEPWLREWFQPILEDVRDQRINIEADNYLLLQRIIQGDPEWREADLVKDRIDRKEASKHAKEEIKADWEALADGGAVMFNKYKANPGGVTPEIAETLLKDMEDRMGPKKWAALERIGEQVEKMNMAAIDVAFDGGLLTEKDRARLRKSKKYVPYSVVELADPNYVTPRNLEREGSTKDVYSPLASLSNKYSALLTMAARNTEGAQVIRDLVKNANGLGVMGAGMVELAPGEVQRESAQRGGNLEVKPEREAAVRRAMNDERVNRNAVDRNEPIELGVLRVYDEGVITDYAVEKAVADAYRINPAPGRWAKAGGFLNAFSRRAHLLWDVGWVVKDNPVVDNMAAWLALHALRPEGSKTHFMGGSLKYFTDWVYAFGMGKYRTAPLFKREEVTRKTQRPKVLGGGKERTPEKKARQKAKLRLTEALQRKSIFPSEVPVETVDSSAVQRTGAPVTAELRRLDASDTRALEGVPDALNPLKARSVQKQIEDGRIARLNAERYFFMSRTAPLLNGLVRGLKHVDNFFGAAVTRFETATKGASALYAARERLAQKTGRKPSSFSPDDPGLADMIMGLDPVTSQILRGATGSPDYMRTGTHGRETNLLSQYIGPQWNSIAAHANIATTPKTALGWWMKLGAIAMPMIGLEMIISGVGSGDDGEYPEDLEDFRREMASIPSYSRHNHLILPWGVNSAGRVGFTAVPIEHNMRLPIGFALRMIDLYGRWEKGVAGTPTYEATQMLKWFATSVGPSPSWWVKGITTSMAGVFGEQVFDSFRNVPIFSDDELASMTIAERQARVAKYTASTAGAFAFETVRRPKDDIPVGLGEKIQRIPFIGKAVRRFYRTSDGGVREAAEAAASVQTTREGLRGRSKDEFVRSYKEGIAAGESVDPLRAAAEWYFGPEARATMYNEALNSNQEFVNLVMQLYLARMAPRHARSLQMLMVGSAAEAAARAKALRERGRLTQDEILEAAEVYYRLSPRFGGDRYLLIVKALTE